MAKRHDITNKPDQSLPEGGTRSSDSDVADFLGKLNQLDAVKAGGTGRGRLIFAMDATLSRQPTWDMALSLQADMFNSVKATGGLDIQLVYFRGFGECRNSKWVGDAGQLAKLMTTVSCRGGRTQIRKIFVHADRENAAEKVNAMVYVGDCMEEDIDELAELAGQLGLKGVPVFLFQEGYDPNAEVAFREFARLSNGAYCRFDAGSAQQLRELLSAVAIFASGGIRALENQSGGTSAGTRLLLEQLK